MYGGNGTTTFALPDLRARVPMGVGERTLDPVPASDAQIPLISSMELGGAAPGQVGVLGMNTVIAMGGVYPSSSGTTSRVYFASVMHFAGNFAPGGWALADGSVLPISSNTALFSLLGVMYGGNGTTTFALPDLRARVAVGSN